MTNSRLRILNICGYSWNIGGPPKVIHDHAEVQVRHGAEVTILTPISPGETVYPAPAGVRVVTCHRHWAARFYPEFSPQLYRWLQRHGNDYDIIHVHGLWHFASLAPFWLTLKPAKVITIHGLLDPWAWRKSRWKKALFSELFQRRIVRDTDLIQVTNPDERADLRRYLGADHPNVVLIPNGIKLSDYARLPERGAFRAVHGIASEQKIILFLSRLNEKKGLDLLLPAFERLGRRRSDVTLILAGPDDGAAGYVTRFIQEHGLQQRARLVGMLTGDVKLSAFVDADVFALPSYSEGFSIAALEALAIGTPALLSDRVGFGAQLREREAAYVLPDLSVDAVETGLQTLLDQPALSRQLAERGQRLVREQYDIEVVAEKLLHAFEQVVHRKTPRETTT